MPAAGILSAIVAHPGWEACKECIGAGDHLGHAARSGKTISVYSNRSSGNVSGSFSNSAIIMTTTYRSGNSSCS